MTPLEVIIILVAAFGAVVAFAGYFHNAPRGLQNIGRQGHTWFDRAGDRPVSERPNEDDRDAPLPRRRLRGRPE